MDAEYKKEIQKRAIPLDGEASLGPLIEKIKSKKVVMLGESSHGTSEFYEWRKKISLELVRNHGFRFIAVEGDWPACQKINDFIKHSKERDPSETLKAFNRWPSWMWANQEIADFITELKDFNQSSEKPVSFHGLDVYSLFDSIDVLLKNLHKIDSDLAKMAGSLFECFEPYWMNEMKYARSLFNYPAGCESEAVETLEKMLSHRLNNDKEGLLFDSIQNARIIKNAEKYYRSMIQADDSWNIRDRHMMETLEMLLTYYGEDSKCIIWEHNTHIGDYRATDMLQQGDINIGGLAREYYGEENVALVGFTTYSGSVIASTAWDGPVLTLPVPESPEESIEGIFHDAVKEVGHDNYYILMDESAKMSPLEQYKGHRAIGVVYYPRFERGNYVSTSLANRYDAFFFFDHTTALTPFNIEINKEKIPETYPFGNKV